MLLDVVILETCQNEIKKFPSAVKEDLLDAVAKLKLGMQLKMPLSRPMPGIGKSVHELRLKERSGQYRIIYMVKKKDAIYLIHAFQKKTKKTLKIHIDLTKKRIRRL